MTSLTTIPARELGANHLGGRIRFTTTSGAVIEDELVAIVAEQIPFLIVNTTPKLAVRTANLSPAPPVLIPLPLPQHMEHYFSIDPDAAVEVEERP